MDCAVKCGVGGFGDVTDIVRHEVDAAAISSGRATVFTRAPDCAVFLNENESGLKLDVANAISRIRHPDATVAGAGSSSVVVPVVDGELWMGDWQRILAYAPGEECDPDLVVQVTGE